MGDVMAHTFGWSSSGDRFSFSCCKKEKKKKEEKPEWKSVFPQKQCFFTRTIVIIVAFCASDTGLTCTTRLNSCRFEIAFSTWRVLYENDIKNERRAWKKYASSSVSEKNHGSTEPVRVSGTHTRARNCKRADTPSSRARPVSGVTREVGRYWKSKYDQKGEIIGVSISCYNNDERKMYRFYTGNGRERCWRRNIIVSRRFRPKYRGFSTNEKPMIKKSGQRRRYLHTAGCGWKITNKQNKSLKANCKNRKLPLFSPFHFSRCPTVPTVIRSALSQDILEPR